VELQPLQQLSIVTVNLGGQAVGFEPQVIIGARNAAMLRLAQSAAKPTGAVPAVAPLTGGRRLEGALVSMKR
jgi:hypothetical protein